MSLLPSEAELLERLDQLENCLLLGERLDTQKLVELMTNLRDELLNCWNIIAGYEDR